MVSEGVVPDLLHVVPIVDEAVLDRVREGEDASLSPSLVAVLRFRPLTKMVDGSCAPNIGILHLYASHHNSVTRTANNGREHNGRSVITSN